MHISVFMGPVAPVAALDKPLIDLCLDLAIESADLGFAMVTFGEQHFNNYEPYCNPFMMGARLAPHLGRTWFGTTIVPLPFHNPLRLAEDSNILDLLTQGRFLMGLSAGRGGPVPDFVAFGLDGSRREEIFDAKLRDLERAQAQTADSPPLVLDSEWDHGQTAGRLMPNPWRLGGAQKAIGTNTDEKIAGVARRGWPIFLGPCLPEVAARKLRTHRDEMAAAGFSPERQRDAARKSLVTRHVFCAPTEEEAWQRAEALVGRNPMMDRVADPRSLQELCTVDVATDPMPRNARHVQEWISAGTPDQLITQLRAYADSGVEQVNVRFAAGISDPRLVRPSFALFASEVLPNIGHEYFPELEASEVHPVHQQSRA